MQTREEWLMRAVEEFADILGPKGLGVSKETGEPLIDAVRVSIGYPRRRRYAVKNCLGGDCLPASMSDEYVHEIFIPPTVSGAYTALRVLEHTISHVVLDSHIKLVGDLVGSPVDLDKIGIRLGPLPHAEVHSADKKADTRLLLAQCPNPACQLVTSRGPWQFRITKGRATQWLPSCACGSTVVVKGAPI